MKRIHWGAPLEGAADGDGAYPGAVPRIAVIGLLLLTLIMPQIAWSVDAGGRENLDIIAEKEADFTLNTATGPISLSDFRGKVVVLLFGYTRCPDICPTSLAFLAQALNSLKIEEQEKVQGIFISLDPHRDTPEHLATYVSHFLPGLIGATGATEEVAEIAARYHVQYEVQQLPGSAVGYVLDHSAHTNILSPEGTLAYQLPHGASPALVAETIRHLLPGYYEKKPDGPAPPTD